MNEMAKKNKGYIPLWRDIQEHWLWKKDDPFDIRSAWIDILLSVNHEEKKILIDGRVQVIKAGQMWTSVKKLASKWNWSRPKVYRYINLLKSDGMIYTDGTPSGTLLTVMNYEKFTLQGNTSVTSTVTPTVTTSVTSSVTTGVTQTIMNKNDIKNDINELEEQAKALKSEIASLKNKKAEQDKNENQDIAPTDNSASETVVNESKPVTVSEGSDMGKAVIDYATQFVGNPYVYGGSSLTNGTDCSGFVMSVYNNFGVSLPHSSSALRSKGTDVGGLENAQPGDIVCYSGHVGLYAGNGQIVHAANSRSGIIISSAYYSTPVCVVSYL